MGFVETWLVELPPLAVYAVVGLVIGLGSMGIPLPVEITLVSAALLAASGVTWPIGVAAAALKRRTRRELALAELDS